MMKVLVVLCCCYVGLVLPQDVFPEFPEDEAKTAQNTTHSTTTKQPSTEITTTTIQATLGTTRAPEMTTELSTSTIEMATPATRSTTTTATKTTAAAYPYPTIMPPRCYFKTQNGTYHLKWVKCGLRWVRPVKCYHCCQYSFSDFEGCNKISNAYCQEL